ncbi:MAG: cytochrome P450 [Novosphingobium sp.]|nr:cytochrome P450 [Novosphingobium sp.]
MNTHVDVLKDANYRLSPSATDAIEQWQAANPDRVPVHTQKWDVADPAIYAEDRWQPIFAEMRATAPINKVTGTPIGEYWNVTTLKPIQHIEALPLIFSSDMRNGGFVLTNMDNSVIDPTAGTNFLGMDPPNHTSRRRTVAPAFTPAEMMRLTELVRERTANVLDELPVGEQFDWVERVSIDLTTAMLTTLFDFPWAYRHYLPFWSDWMSDSRFGEDPELGQMRLDAMMEMADCFGKLWEQRRNAPETPDLLSRMIHSEAMSEQDPMEFMSNMALLIVGGNDTTRNTMTGIVEALDRFPDERAKLEADPSLIPNAVQECIRYVTPVAHMRRTAMQDYEIDGQLIKAGDKVALWYISANRDETIFTDPDRLIVDRENARRHVSFGYGVHRCVGARLAELQLRVLIEEMLKRRMRVHVTGTVTRLRQNFIHGFSKAEVTIEKA